jgi:hypothetical protein
LGYNRLMILAMLRWWYGTGWIQAAHRISLWTKGVERAFSVSILAQTLFSPWHRIVSVGGKTMDDKMRAAIDNLISRLVGSAVRGAVLIAAFFSMLGVFLVAVFIVGIWPILPVSVIYFLVRSITG